tara:strand:+ start:47 stop:271 length:225 start_codon:yes stop_codon:yes gene_type:complete
VSYDNQEHAREKQGDKMTKDNDKDLVSADRSDAFLDSKTSELLSQIKQEPIPDRLLELAMKLQQALNEREEKPS